MSEFLGGILGFEFTWLLLLCFLPGMLGLLSCLICVIILCIGLFWFRVMGALVVILLGFGVLDWCFGFYLGGFTCCVSSIIV